ncbi:MAG TPA: hypothetical protein VEF89_02820 [Solirubrobacteraceae bacterium]|nr:hypothetical protein [Solirubrobacteraceae bacterium]
MVRTWLAIEVELLGGGGIECDPPPGRVMIVGPSHTFAQLAEAIDAAFARWDLSHLHEFELPDGRLVGYPDDTYESDVVWLDHAKLKVARELKPGMEFSYVFDLGDNWRHRCRIQERKVDPLDAYGVVPSAPVPVWGWGSIPDQYGRRSRDGSDEDEEW